MLGHQVSAKAALAQKQRLQNHRGHALGLYTGHETNVHVTRITAFITALPPLTEMMLKSTPCHPKDGKI